MRTAARIAILMALLPNLAAAQFVTGGTSGGGGTTNSARPWSSFKLNPKTRVKLDFRNANIDSVLALFQRTSGISIVKDPGLTGTLTVTSAKAVDLNQAFSILATTLRLKNYELVKEDNLLVVRPRPQQPPQPAFDPSMFQNMNQQRETVLRVYVIQYANASELSRVINDVFQEPPQQGQPGGFPVQFGGGGGGFRRFGGGGGFPFGGQNRGQNRTVRASSDDFSNSVIVNAPETDQRQVQDLIRQLDKNTEDPQAPRVFKLQYANAQEVAPVVQNVLVATAPRGKGGVGQQNTDIGARFQQAIRFGSSQAAFGQVVAETRSNSIIVTATKQNLDTIEKVVSELDKPVEIQATTFVFPLGNARADDVASLLTQAFGQRQGANGRGLNTGRTNTNQQTNRRTNTNRPGAQQPGGGLNNRARIEADEQALAIELQDPNAEQGELATNVTVGQFFGGGGGFFGGQNRQGQQQNLQGRDAQGRLVPVQDLTGQVTAIPDPNTNSIIVVTTPENADIIKRVIGQLDRIPEQVVIQTIIVEATLDATTRLGVEWNYNQARAFGQQGVTGNLSNSFGLQNANPALDGLRYTVTGGNLDVFLNAIQTDDKFQVLSTPRIFTSNNTEAQINISQSVPYVVSSIQNPNGGFNFNYSFLDVGIVLTVTPRITSNGYVTMDVLQTANDLQGFTDFQAPIVNQRQAETTVTVQDGATVVLGGIIRDSVTANVRKVPLIGDIPLLGQLFRSTTRRKQKTELLVFLTPKIVHNAEDARRLREQGVQELSKPSKDQLKSVASDLLPAPKKPTGPGGTPAPAPKNPGDKPKG